MKGEHSQELSDTIIHAMGQDLRSVMIGHVYSYSYYRGTGEKRQANFCKRPFFGL